MSTPALQRQRLLTQLAFFALFALAPLFDLFRFDLNAGHAYFLTGQWHIGIDDYLARRITTVTAAVNLALFLFLPVFGTAALLVGVAWKWGRIYCGWLCPHFWVVETLNRLTLHATGKHSLWERRQTPPWTPDGRRLPRDARYWWLAVPLAMAIALLWAIIGLTYLLPPVEVYRDLFAGNLGRHEILFITLATTALSLEFLFARHLFCRYACSVGLFQSFAWIANRKALVVGFERSRLTACADCLGGHGPACDAVCPMRLKPRNVKRWMFSCTQCGLCLSACATVNREDSAGPRLRWVSNDEARRNEARFSLRSQSDEDAGSKV